MRAVWIADILCVVGGDFWFEMKVRRLIECKLNGMAGAWNSASDAKGKMMRKQENSEEVGTGQWQWRR